ncbi:MAG: SMP-30/gluconolactonase/LRE family protein [Acidobacteriia bacterium]|nr:SMP-30/gluconolactonase/LRE family protein [Terriglobia bacterium]
MSRYWVICVLASVPIAWADAGAGTVYQLQTIAGSCPSGSGAATSAKLGTINGIALDHSGNIYFSDSDNHLVRKIDLSGAISTLAGTCAAGFSGDGGPAASAQLNQPYGVAVDSAGNVYVADYGNSRIRRIGTDHTISTVAGNGQAGQAGDGGAATSAQLLTPRNVAVDSNGNLFLSEFLGHRVRKVSTNGKISTVAGIGIAGFAGDGGPATAAQLNTPMALQVDHAGALYIADSQNQRIRKVQGGTISTLLGPSVPLTAGGSATLYNLISLAVDTGGTVYLAEALSSNPRVDWYSTSAGMLTNEVTVAALKDIAVDASGTLYIAAGTQIQRLNGTGAVLQTVAGGSVGDGGSATAAQLLQPTGVALDAQGNLHIADALNQRMRRVNLAAQIGTEAGVGTQGCSTDGGLAAAGQLNMPTGVAVDSTGNVFIAERGCHRIRQVTADGHMNTMVGCDPSSTGCQGLGQEGLSGAKMPLNSPQGVCTDHAGVVYIVDTGNNRVLRAAPGAGVVTAAGNGSVGYSGDGYLAQLAQLNGPTACALDATGNLYIADTGNHVVRKVTLDGFVATVAGTGVAGFGGDGGQATSASLYGPGGIIADGGGNIYISDTSNDRIRKVTPDGVIQTIAGDGSSTSIRAPRGLTLDGSGNLYFADQSNNLVRKLVPQSAPAAPPPAQPIPLSVENAASLLTGPVAPGELISIMGTGLGPQVGVTGAAGSNGLISSTVSGTQVQFDGNPAPILYTQANQVNLQVPYSVSGAASTTMTVLYNGQQVGSQTLQVVSAAPALFSTVANQDGSINSQGQPAPKNSVITLYATGEGLTTGSNLSGQPAAAPYAQPVGSVALTIGGMPAQLLYAGSAPGLVGLMQINARTPPSFVASGQASVVLTVGGASSPALSIWLQ